MRKEKLACNVFGGRSGMRSHLAREHVTYAANRKKKKNIVKGKSEFINLHSIPYPSHYINSRVMRLRGEWRSGRIWKGALRGGRVGRGGNGSSEETS